MWLELAMCKTKGAWQGFQFKIYPTCYESTIQRFKDLDALSRELEEVGNVANEDSRGCIYRFLCKKEWSFASSDK